METQTHEVKRAEFLARRRKGVFATDVAPICRLSRFGYGPLDVAVDKLLARERPENESQRLGRWLEPIVGRLYEERTGTKLEEAPPAFGSPLPWMGAHADWIGGTRKLVEGKTTGDSRGWGDPEFEQVPQDIFLQVQWQMACYGADEADVAVLFNLSEFVIYPIRRDRAVIDRAIDICGRFWDIVGKGNYPELDWTDPRTPELVPLLHRPDKARHVQLAEEDLALVKEYQELGRAIATMETLRKEQKARIMDRMGDAGVGLLPDGRRVANTVVTVKTHTVETHTSRRLFVSGGGR